MEHAKIIDLILDVLSTNHIRMVGKPNIISKAPESMLMHIQAWPRSCWFKMILPQNISEFYVTRSLNEYCVSGMPEVIEYFEDFRSLLMWEADGEELFNISSLNAWITAVETFAVMQLETYPLLDNKWKDIFKDWSIPSLLEKQGTFFEKMILIMERQTTLSPPAMMPDELRWLSHRMRDVLFELAEQGYGQMLIHGDLNPRNIIVGNRCVFLDWVPTGIGYFSMPLDALQSYRARDYGYSKEDSKVINDAYYSVLGIDPNSKYAVESAHIAPVIRRFVTALEAMEISENYPERRLAEDSLLRSLTRWIYRHFREE